VSSSSCSERMDYSGEDVDWENVLFASDRSKFSHLATKDMEATSAEGKLWLRCTFLYSLYRPISDIFPFGTFFRNSGGWYQRGDC